MKKNEVPQDQDPSFEGGKKLCYALDELGKFVPVKTSGWKIEADAKDFAWRAIHSDLEATKNRVKHGHASPLEYFMKFRQMDRGLLAQNMGFSSFRVWWHLRPKNFLKMNQNLLMKYADCLTIPFETLKNFKGD